MQPHTRLLQLDVRQELCTISAALSSFFFFYLGQPQNNICDGKEGGRGTHFRLRLVFISATCSHRLFLSWFFLLEHTRSFVELRETWRIPTEIVSLDQVPIEESRTGFISHESGVQSLGLKELEKKSERSRCHSRSPLCFP